MRALSLQRRTFAATALALLVCLLGTFAAVTTVLRHKVRAELKESLAAQERSEEQLQAESARRTRNLIEALTENSGLKASIGLAKEIRSTPDAQIREQLDRTIDEQLTALAGTAGYDLVVLRDNDGQVLGAVERDSGYRPIPPASLAPTHGGILEVRARLYEAVTVPVRMRDDLIGDLELGQRFALPAAGEGRETMLLRKGAVAASTIPEANSVPVAQAIKALCRNPSPACEVHVGKTEWLVQAIRTSSFSGEYQLLCLQSIDQTSDRMLAGLIPGFLAIGGAAILLVFGLSAGVSRTVSRPVQALIDRLNRIGEGPLEQEIASNFPVDSPSLEVNLLGAAFNRASQSIQTGQERLRDAYIAFIRTLSEVLDARDRYTAGHSRRVMEYSVAIAEQIGCPAPEIETLRIGALLHDIGKIGIPDAILQKPGKLTDEEYERIKEHPQIGKRMLAHMEAFEKYLPVIELHHEDFDGRGYPYGLRAEGVPLLARIVHVADAYDAMSSDRAYRRRLPEERVREILERCAGTQFDPALVEGFLSVLSAQDTPTSQVSSA